MKKDVIIIGSGGHGKVISEIVKLSGDNFIGFLDDSIKKNVLGPISDYKKYDALFIIGIGNQYVRKKISLLDCEWYTAIHPSAIISPSAVIGEGSVIMSNSVINTNSKVGNHCIINTAAVVEHDNIIEDFVHISVGVKLAGNVIIKRNTWLGIGSVVSNNLTICEDCLIGAGSVVVNDIYTSGIYYGVPAVLRKYIRWSNF